MGTLALTISRNLLKYAVGQHMLCPKCEAILDCRKAVHTDVVEAGTGRVISLGTLCIQCFEESKYKASYTAAVAKLTANGHEVTRYDGRELFGKGRKA